MMLPFLLVLLLWLHLFGPRRQEDGEAGGDEEDVSVLIFYRRCFFFLHINRSFCLGEEQKDDTISCHLAVRVCVCVVVFPLSLF